MKRSRLVWIIALVAVLALGLGAGWWWQQQTLRAAILREAVPPRPDLSNWAPELGKRVAACEQRLATGDEPLAALAELSRLYHVNGFLAEARQCYEALEVLDPAEARWFHRHAVILAGFGDIEGARARWRRVADLAPDYLTARLRLADLCIKADDFAAAKAEYQTVLARFPDQPYALLGLARCALNAERWEEARGLLERVVTLTNYKLGYDLIMSVYEKLGLTADAARVRGMYRTFGAYRDPADPWLLELDEDCYNSFHLSLASGAAELEGDLALARRRIERAIALAPEQGTLYFQYGNTLLKQKQYTAARAQFERCTQIQPTFSDGWAFLSSVLESVGDRAGADRILAEGLRLCPNSPGLHLQNGRRLQREKRPEEALAEFRLSARLRPNEADAFLAIATTLITLGRKAEGLEAVDQALVAEPEHPIALGIRTFDAIDSGSEASARTWLRRVANQPRVEDRDRERLLAAYRERFGRAFE